MKNFLERNSISYYQRMTQKPENMSGKIHWYNWNDPQAELQPDIKNKLINYKKLVRYYRIGNKIKIWESNKHRRTYGITFFLRNREFYTYASTLVSTILGGRGLIYVLLFFIYSERYNYIDFPEIRPWRKKLKIALFNKERRYGKQKPFKHGYVFTIIFPKKKLNLKEIHSFRFFPKKIKNLFSIIFKSSNLLKLFNTFSLKKLNINFLRKKKIFNKGRYSRNRQYYRTGVYWCLYINIIAVLGFYYWFFKVTFNFGYLWWLFFMFFVSFFFPKFFKHFSNSNNSFFFTTIFNDLHWLFYLLINEIKNILSKFFYLFFCKKNFKTFFFNIFF